MTEYILFDFDGTVFDTAEGITKSAQFALKKLGIEAEIEDLMCFAGPPLADMFAEKYGMNEETAELAVSYYRERYKPIGWAECSPFEGMPEMLRKLKEQGKILAVATSKPEFFTNAILEKYDMTDIFDFVGGSLFDGTRGKKWEVIDYVLGHYGIKPEDAIMVGDRKYDVIGASKCGVKCIGVEFGYAEPGELEEHGAVYVAKTPDDLYEYLMK